MSVALLHFLFDRCQEIWTFSLKEEKTNVLVCVCILYTHSLQINRLPEALPEVIQSPPLKLTLGAFKNSGTMASSFQV